MLNNLVATSQVSFPAVLFDCPLMCQANMCLRKVKSKDSDCLYIRRGNFTSRSAREYYSVQFLISFRVNIINYVIATCEFSTVTVTMNLVTVTSYLLYMSVIGKHSY